MAGAIAICMEGVVLDEDAGSYPASLPISTGVALARILHDAGTGPLYFVTQASIEVADYWLRVNGLKFSRVVAPEPQDADLSPSELQRRQLARLRTAGGLWLAITAYPEVALWCLQSGQSGLCFTTGRYALVPQEKPSWAALAAGTKRARELMGYANAQEPVDDLA